MNEEGEAVHHARWQLRVGGRVLAVPREGLLIGRALDAAVRLSGGLVSREHARVRVVDGRLFVEDLGSRNGVLVNDRRITGRTRLGHGDVVLVGVERIEIVDASINERPAHLSTMPPPSRTGIAPPGAADVDAAQQTTLAASTDVLSERERQVLELVVLGHTQAEIAKQLHAPRAHRRQARMPNAG